ncbi:MAG: septum formation initiator family protein [Clostridia bacterium]|nr:septum formation initiator family protein [Clostridia bacterium]
MQQKRLGFFGKLALIAIVFFLVISIVDKNIEINSLKREEEKKRQELQSYTLQVERLNSQLEEEVSGETIKRIAREKLNLRDPNELVYANDLPN